MHAVSQWLRNAEAWLDARGKGAWILAMILGFIFAWPVGLALLVYMIWSNRMFSFSRRHCCAHKHHSHRSTGNSAFDAYKEDTLKRLEEEQSAFQAFMERLRKAKDKAEFDQFMDDRRRNSNNGPSESPA